MLLVAMLLATPLLTFAPRAHAASDQSAPAQAKPIRVGSVLVALRDVKLREATIARGSRVEVVRIVTKDGKPSALDLELKDGHVLRGVAYRIVRTAFRQART